jgi:hypothetical protein
MTLKPLIWVEPIDHRATLKIGITEYASITSIKSFYVSFGPHAGESHRRWR